VFFVLVGLGGVGAACLLIRCVPVPRFSCACCAPRVVCSGAGVGLPVAVSVAVFCALVVSGPASGVPPVVGLVLPGALLVACLARVPARVGALGP
jgi:hypothetical protein